MTCVAVCALAPPGAGAAPDDARLADLRREIHALQDTLAADSSRLIEAREREQRVASDIAAAQARQSELERSIARKSARVDALIVARRNLEQRHAGIQAALHRQTLARYALLVQPPLKRLLNQGDARRLGRDLVYSDYLIAAYRRDLEQARTAARALVETAAALKLETDSLRRLRHETATHLVQLREVQARHAELQAAMAASVDAGVAQVEQLQEDEQRLLALLGSLAAAPAATVVNLARPVKTPSGPDFATLAGKLAWPAAGEVVSAAGGTIRKGGAHWAGVLIETAPVADVHAVAAGRVVFADRFRNLGQLLIVDHGEGYMTLYGNAAQLHKSPGDDVAAGDVVAQVGVATGELPRGLYFELRADGQPLDPRQWCVQR